MQKQMISLRKVWWYERGNQTSLLEGQTMIYKIRHIKLKIEQQLLHLKLGANTSVAVGLLGLVVPAPLVISYC